MTPEIHGEGVPRFIAVGPVPGTTPSAQVFHTKFHEKPNGGPQAAFPKSHKTRRYFTLAATVRAESGTAESAQPAQDSWCHPGDRPYARLLRDKRLRCRRGQQSR